jgi:Ca2+-transporting ATPase
MSQTNTFYSLSVNASIAALKTSRTGLRASEVKARQQKYGLNAIVVRGEPFWRIVITPFIDVFTAVLGLAAVISIWHGAHVDAIIISAIILIDAVIYYVQRFSTERVLRALQKKDNHIVSVLRGSTIPTSINATQLVPGDCIVLNEGDKVPADARIIKARSLQVDESLLTGESLPINKQPQALGALKEVYEQSNMLFQGSFIAAGHATALVTTTGNRTQFGQLAALAASPVVESPVQQKINALIGKIVRVVGGVSVAAFVLSLYRGMDIGEALQFVLALAVSAIPESLPIAISVILVLGMRRMAARKALVRAMQAIETVGTLTTIATDKTGTLTQNKLTVQATWQPKDNTTMLTNAIALSTTAGTVSHDPLDAALLQYTQKAHIPIDEKPIMQFPFEQTVAMSGNIWQQGSKRALYVKGAPEQLIERSHLSRQARLQAQQQLHHYAQNGFRVIAFAHLDNCAALKNLTSLSSSASLTFDGLVAIADILRPEAQEAIALAQGAGISVRMITGDHAETAFHIGHALGLTTHRNQVLDTRVLRTMPDDELERIIDNITVFARVTPENKHRILTILKKKHITAMTGDGVNDVPALTNAHVGVAMGSGTSIAKEAGDIILLDDNFKSIVGAINEGRIVYANIQRMVAYLLSTNAGEIIVVLSSLIAGVPVPLVAVQFLWVNLVTDTAMVIPLGLEPGEKDTMKRPPHAPNAPLLHRFMLRHIVYIAIIMATTTMLIYTYELSKHSVDYARTIAFHVLVVMQWASALSFRSEHESVWQRLRCVNKSFYVGLGVAVGAQIAVLTTPLGSFLHLTQVPATEMLRYSIITFVSTILLIELHKHYGKRRQ